MSKKIFQNVTDFAIKKDGVIKELDEILYKDKILWQKQFTPPDSFKLTFDLPDGISADDVELVIPKLKFDKNFVFTFNIDDAAPGAYSYLFNRIHGKWIDYFYRFHLTTPTTKGYVSMSPLEFSNHTGVKRRFTIESSIWPTLRDAWNLDGKMKEKTNTGVYIDFNDLRRMRDFGCTVNHHNIDEYELTTPIPHDVLNAGLLKDREKIHSELGMYSKILSVPGEGDVQDDYYQVGLASNFITFLRTAYHESDYHLYTDKAYKKVTRGGLSTSGDDRFAQLSLQHDSLDPIWQCKTHHNITPYGDGTNNTEANYETSANGYIDFLEKLQAYWGSNGDNTLWVTTTHELYEYIDFREHATIQKEVNGKTITFTVTTPFNNETLFRECSLFLKGIPDSNLINLQLTQENTSYFAYQNKYSRNENTLGILINITQQENATAILDKYVRLLEETQLEEYRNDALYLMSLINVNLPTSYKTRIDAVPFQPRPYLVESVIVSYDNKVYDRNIIIHSKIQLLNYQNQQVEYKAPIYSKIFEVTDDREDIYDTKRWSKKEVILLPTSEPGTYTLTSEFEVSPKEGLKLIELSLTNYKDEGSSDRLEVIYEQLQSPSITLLELSTTPTSEYRNISIIINFNSISDALNPTHYFLTENPDELANPNWIPFYSDTIPFTLSEKGGLKTIYGILKNDLETTTSQSVNVLYLESDPEDLIHIKLNQGWEHEYPTGTVYDITTGFTLASGAVTGSSLYDVNGKPRGTINITNPYSYSLVEPAGNGVPTGDNSAIYPDKVIVKNVGCNSQGSELIHMNLPFSYYKVSIYINSGSVPLQLQGGEYTLTWQYEDGSEVIPFETQIGENLYVNNYNIKHTLENNKLGRPTLIQIDQYFGSKASNTFLTVIEIEEINYVEPAPVIIDFYTTDGSTVTTSNSVELNMSVTGDAHYYKISEESPIFDSLTWSTFENNPIPTTYTFNDSTPGEKIIFLQIATEHGTLSNIKNIVITKVLAPPTAKLNFGWSWFSGSVPGSNYDPVTGFNKVLMTLAVGSNYKLYDINGIESGSFRFENLSVTGSYYQGKAGGTGNESGVYPDAMLQYSAQLGNSSSNGKLHLNIPRGKYKITIYINTNQAAGLTLTGGEYQLLPGQVEIAWHFNTLIGTGSYKDNFTLTHSEVIDTTYSPTNEVIIQLSSIRLLVLNVVEIESLLE